MTLATAVGMTYVDLWLCGGLRNAVALRLRLVGSSLRVDPMDRDGFLPVCASVHRPPRAGYIYIGDKERAFWVQLWAKGVNHADAQTKSLTEAAAIIDMWVAGLCDTASLRSRFRTVEVMPHAVAFERGEEVEARWRSYLRGMCHPELDALVHAAYRRPQLAVLFPFTSLYILCFSRCTGVPYTHDIPSVLPLGNGQYRVYESGLYKPRPGGGFDTIKPERELGIGTAEEAADIVVANLPANCGPAVAGTAKDLVPIVSSST